MNLRVSLIGAGDVDYHYSELLGIDKDKYYNEVELISEVLVNENVEIVLLPDRGVCFEVAKEYRKNRGVKVLGSVPLSDKEFGIKHLEKYMKSEIEGKKIFDEFIDTETWYKQDLVHTTLGDFVLMLGNSLGSLGELVYGFYLYKLFNGVKPEVEANESYIHPEIRARRYFPFSVVVYIPFMKEKLNYEIEKYVEKVGGRIYYVSDSGELIDVIKKFKDFVD